MIYSSHRISITADMNLQPFICDEKKTKQNNTTSNQHPISHLSVLLRNFNLNTSSRIQNYFFKYEGHVSVISELILYLSSSISLGFRLSVLDDREKLYAFSTLYQITRINKESSCKIYCVLSHVLKEKAPIYNYKYVYSGCLFVMKVLLKNYISFACLK